ncbi:hypothetical protein ABTX71_17210 [Streptomyces parvulus]|uniref:hypothetical protein n=1 Tax=Streptomyces parvulus TaxID=146923 RepID=UPI003321D59E
MKQNPCGCFRVEAVAPSTVDPFFGHPGRHMVMNSAGIELKLTDYHPDDFLT